MKITIEATAKEIADLIREIQDQPRMIELYGLNEDQEYQTIKTVVTLDGKPIVEKVLAT